MSTNQEAQSAQTADLRTELADLEAAFAEAGGRGVDLADRIDALRARLRLEELRAEIRAERISYGEIVELQDLAAFVDPGDTELLEWAGVPEHASDPLPVHRVTIYVRDEEPRFEDYTTGDDVISVSIDPNIGEYDSDSGEMTVFEESTP